MGGIMNKIVLTADIIEFSDDFLRSEYQKFKVKFDTLNERTKEQTKEIRELNRIVKELEKELHK